MDLSQFMSVMGLSASAWPGLLFLLLWSLFWKGCALWQAARRGSSWWFVILIIVNTIGILEIIYLFLILKLKLSQLFHDETTH